MNVLGGSSGLDGSLLPQGPKLVSEINVTPFVDVMLVLLIIFMVSAPMLTVGVPVDLPQASLNPLPHQDKPLDISIQKDGVISVGQETSSLSELPLRPLVMEAKQQGTRVRLRADAQVHYEKIVAVIEALSSAGITQVGLIARAKTPDIKSQGVSP